MPNHGPACRKISLPPHPPRLETYLEPGPCRDANFSIIRQLGGGGGGGGRAEASKAGEGWKALAKEMRARASLKRDSRHDSRVTGRRTPGGGGMCQMQVLGS